MGGGETYTDTRYRMGRVGGSFAGDSSWSLCEGLEAGDCLGGGERRAGEGGRELEVLELGMTISTQLGPSLLSHSLSSFSL
jgi:hypothetical protein